MEWNHVSMSLLPPNNETIFYTGSGFHLQIDGFSFPKICVKNNQELPVRSVEFRNKKLEILDKNSKFCDISKKYQFIINRVKSRGIIVYKTIESGMYEVPHSYPKTITNIRYNRYFLIVGTIDSYYIYKLPSFGLIKIYQYQPANPYGVFDITTNHQKLSFLAIPGHNSDNEIGTVQIYNLTSNKEQGRIYAHQHPLACLVYSPNGSMLATASIRGTKIYVYTVDTRHDYIKLYELTRGYCPVDVTLNFSTCNDYIITTTSTTTIHVFKLEDNRVKKENWLTWTLSRISSKLQNDLSVKRAFSVVNIPDNRGKCLATIIRDDDSLFLIVVNNEGEVYLYDFLQKGGVNNLIKKYRIVNEGDFGSDFEDLDM